MSALTIEHSRAEALFASDLQRSETASPEMIRDTVAAMVRRLGVCGCAARVAEEFGEHPETAVSRMQWCRTAVRDAYGTV
jgi:hypothetical protein